MISYKFILKIEHIVYFYREVPNGVKISITESLGGYNSGAEEKLDSKRGSDYQAGRPHRLEPEQRRIVLEHSVH
jgi:hypothetical protein